MGSSARAVKGVSSADGGQQQSGSQPVKVTQPRLTSNGYIHYSAIFTKTTGF